MTETAYAPVSTRRATDDKDSSSDEDPGPSCFHLLIECDGWRTLDGLEPALLCAYEACTQHVPAISGKAVTLLLSADEAIAALNGRYRDCEEPTNVLSFPTAALSCPALLNEGRPQLGDIIIAHETVMREAAEADKPPLFHLMHLAIHGLLHLAGFDHRTDIEAERMESLERRILRSIDIPDPYSINPNEQPVIAG